MAPIGTSPALAEARASASASFMNRVSVSIFGQRIAWGKRRNGINTEITEAQGTQRMNEMRVRTKERRAKERSGLLDNWGGEKQTNAHAGTPRTIVSSRFL